MAEPETTQDTVATDLLKPRAPLEHPLIEETSPHVQGGHMKRLSELVELAKKKHSGRLVVAGGHDPDMIQATARAALEGLVEVILVADETKVEELLERESPPHLSPHAG